MKALEFGDWFIIGIVAMQLCAVVGYLYKRRWLEAVVYTCYMMAQVALLLLSMRGRA